MAIQAVVFDAYGTLFDVYSIGALPEKLYPRQGAALAVLRRGGAEPVATMPGYGIDRGGWTDHDSLEAEQAGFALASLMIIITVGIMSRA